MQISALFSAKLIILIRRSTWKLLCIGMLLAAVLLVQQNFQQVRAGTNIKIEKPGDIRVFSTDYPYFSYRVDESSLPKNKEKQLSYKIASPLTEMLPYDYYTFSFINDSKEQILHYSPTLNAVYNEENYLVDPSPALKEVLLGLVASYRQKAHWTYGALLPWEEADQIFPMFATARITDIYSGSSFYVQRREGSNHVDAQPLTAEDTAIMKKIYDGRWSWERKGIIVEVQGYRIAASMHGMPHGGGKIDDNNFPGHFCIHFLGSTIHGGGMDSRHQQEILKAAGKLPLDYSDLTVQ